MARFSSKRKLASEVSLMPAFKKWKAQQAGWGSKSQKERLLKSILHPEIKEFVTTSAGSFVNISANGLVINLIQIAQGSDVVNRIGRHIEIKGVDIQWAFISPTDSGGVGYDNIVMTVVSDRQSNNTTLVGNYGTIFDATEGAFLTVKNTQQYRDRFRVHHEERAFVSTSLSTTAANAGDNVNQFGRIYVDFTKKANSKIVEYQSTGAAVPSSNNVMLCFGSLQNTGLAASAAGVRYYAKVTFTDM